MRGDSLYLYLNDTIRCQSISTLSFIHSFIHQIFMECLLCTRHCSKPKQSKISAHMELLGSCKTEDTNKIKLIIIYSAVAYNITVYVYTYVKCNGICIERERTHTRSTQLSLQRRTRHKECWQQAPPAAPSPGLRCVCT